MKKLSTYTLSLTIAFTSLASTSARADLTLPVPTEWTWPLDLAIKTTFDVASAGVAAWLISNADTELQMDTVAKNECNGDQACTAAVTDVLAKRPSVEAMGALTMTSSLIAATIAATATGVAVAELGASAYGCLLEEKAYPGKANYLQVFATWFYAASYVPTAFSLVTSVIATGVMLGVTINDHSLIPADLKTAVLVTGASALPPLVINFGLMGLGAFRLLRLHCMRSTDAMQIPATPV